VSPGSGISGIAEPVRSRERSAREVTTEAIERIERIETSTDALNAFISYDRDVAIRQAAAIDVRIETGENTLALAGVPIAIKDNIATLDFDTTCASKILKGYRSPYDATAIRRLKEAGAVIIGKTNMDEFGMGSSTEFSAFGPTRNPLDRTRVPGGSSGGSAAAVAAGLVAGALGSETGGSVRQPAAFCGIVGIKPGYGRVSRYGLVAYASSLDQIGVFGRTVRDAALLLDVISGHDPLDSTSTPMPVDPVCNTLSSDIDRLVIGVPREYFPEQLDPRIADLCRTTLQRFAALGATIREVSLPHTAYAIPTYYLIATAEASTNLARYDGVRYGVRADTDSTAELYARTRSEGFGEEVKRRIMLGTYALSAGYYDAYYARAQKVRTLIARDFTRVFDDGVDVLFTPTAPTTAFALCEKSNDPYAMYLSDCFTVTANLAGVPAMSIPVGLVDGLPVGGQLLAKRGDEATMVRAAYALEQALHV